MKPLVLMTILGCTALAFAQSSAPAPAREPFEVVRVRPNMYMLASMSGNVIVELASGPGRDGVLLVNTGPMRLTRRIMAEIRKLSDQPIRFILNTSADESHVGGNADFAALSPSADAVRARDNAAAVFAQDNVLTRMSSPAGNVPAQGWPTITFDEMKAFPFNGESIVMFAEKNAHTDGDSIVHFRGSNVVATGDIFLTTGYPVIDLQRGGSIQGELKALNHIIDITVPEIMQEGGTLVIPGVGRLCDEADVTEYRDMLTILRDRVADLLKKGKTLAEVKQARLSRDYDGRYSTPAWTGDMLIEAIYKSLSQGSGGK
jgi:glyoxylase-like metal-dependent hydrolase (beta-lactamase superfamily II)